MTPKTIFIVAGEASGDHHGALLAKSLLAKNARLKLLGIGSQHMRDAGVDIVDDLTQHANTGLVEIVSGLGKIIQVFNKTVKTLKQLKPDLIVFIDFPEFNLRLAKRAKKLGIKTLYYISPQIWASRPKRIKIIKQCIDSMAVILPFEVDYYKKFGVTAHYVGHPLINKLTPRLSQKQAREFYNIAADKKVVALLPGSRKSEARYLLPEYYKAAKILLASNPELQFIIPVAPTLSEAFLQSLLPADDLPITYCQGKMIDSVNMADAAIVASGTASFEVAMLGLPMIIVYKVSPITAWVAKQVITVKYLGLANLLADEAFITELLQKDATPENMAHCIQAYLNSDAARNGFLEQSSKLKHKLMSHESNKLPLAQLVLDQLV